MPPVWQGDDNNLMLAGVARETLCREVRQWLLHSGIWKLNIEQKALVYARALAGALDDYTYIDAAQNAKVGHPPPRMTVRGDPSTSLPLMRKRSDTS